MTEEIKIAEAAPRAEKKVVAKKSLVEMKKIEVENNVLSEMKTTVTDAVKSSTDAVKETVSKVTSSVADAAKSSVDTIKETTTKVTATVSDATKSSVDAIKEVTTSTTDTLKDTYTSIETAISDSRVAGSYRAKKILAALFDDNVNKTINNIVGNIGEVTAVCATVVCAPMTISADGVNTLYKKMTA